MCHGRTAREVKPGREKENEESIIGADIWDPLVRRKVGGSIVETLAGVMCKNEPV
jgi:hypothetical protein